MYYSMCWKMVVSMLRTQRWWCYSICWAHWH